MRTNVFPLRFVLCALCALAVWCAPAFSQRLERGLEVDTIHSNAKVRPDVPVKHAMHDWTHDYMLYPRLGPMNRLIELQKDPRAIQHWQESYRKDYVRWRRDREGHHSQHHNRFAMHPDWNFFVGTGAIAGSTVTPSVYPAKWTFDSNENLSTAAGDQGACATDYLVVPVNATQAGGGAPPGPGQPSIIGLNNLYSGTAGLSGTGVCNGGTGTRVTGASDTGDSATTLFSYTVLGDDGVVQTSPVTSMDGTLIAFVEGSGFGLSGVSHFHVLAWNPGDGNNPADRQDALTNAVQVSTFATSTPLAAGTVTDLPLNTSDTFSSPYVEYSDDVAYVGDDLGEVYKIKNIFCPSWAPCGTAAPSLDTTWGTGGIVTLGTCGGFVSSVTVDGASGNIFAGCSDGLLYSITPDGKTVTSLAVGDGNGTDGGIVDAPVLDNVNGWVYVETGSCVSTLTNCATGGVGLGAPVLVQASVSNLNTNSVAALGPGGNSFNIHAPAFNDAYFTSANPTDWLLFDYSSDNVGPNPPNPPNLPEIVVYGITFGANHVMTGGTPTNLDQFTVGAFEVAPLTEFLTTGIEDRLFASALTNSINNVVSFNITSGFPTALEGNVLAPEGSGTTGIVVDNTSSAAGQANSIYFGVLGAPPDNNANTVVKLTQVDLQ